MNGKAVQLRELMSFFKIETGRGGAEKFSHSGRGESVRRVSRAGGHARAVESASDAEFVKF